MSNLPEQTDDLQYLDSLREKLSKNSLENYQVLANESLRKVMPNALNNHQVFLCLGLCGEVGEVMELIKRYQEGRRTMEEIRKSLVDELGDVLWFLSTLAISFDISLKDLALSNLKKVRARKLKGFYESNQKK